MNPKIALIGEDISIDVKDPDFYENMLEVIETRVSIIGDLQTSGRYSPRPLFYSPQ
jgi:hypothetical protein